MRPLLNHKVLTKLFYQTFQKFNFLFMYGRKVKLRFFFIITVLIILVLTVFLILKSFEENVVYFQSPSDIKSFSEVKKKKIRVGGMVKINSILIDQNKLNFIITDFSNELNVSYSGVIPNLFSEGKGVVAEGYLKDKNFFVATKILAKHDENYMPPEVKEALGKSKFGKFNGYIFSFGINCFPNNIIYFNKKFKKFRKI